LRDVRLFCAIDHSLTNQSARSLQVPPSNRHFINDSKPASALLAFSCATTPEFPAILKNEIIEREKSECIESLLTALTKTSRWRRKLVDQYADPRNARLTSGDLLF
jgi:hypothetical protein